MLIRFKQFLYSSFERFRSRGGGRSLGRTSSEDSRDNRDLSPDELPDQLLCHMLECGCCLNPAGCSCPIYNEFQVLIGLNGGASKPALFAI